MPVTPTYPGVYIEELPSGVRTITGVATSITAFIGRALRGPADDPVRIHSFADFERRFGGLWIHSTMSYAVQHYFLNGGTDALIVRVHKVADNGNGTDKATLTLPAGSDDPLTLEAASEGDWSNSLQATVDHDTSDDTDTTLFNLTIEDAGTGVSETFRNLTTDAEEARYVTKFLDQESDLVRVSGTVPQTYPDPNSVVSDDGGDDGEELTSTEYEGNSSSKTGIYALDSADLFNLLCIPPITRQNDSNSDINPSTLAAALSYCKTRRALLLVDPPSSWNQASTVAVDSLNLADEDAAIYFPRLKMADPLQENRLEEFAPCGAVAGVLARTDSQRGVWKAPAGLDATLRGVRELTVKLTDEENGQLNPVGVNCLRTFPVVGHVVRGARTLRGADRLASEWKYLPVRRLALYIEESLYRGTQRR